MSIYNHYHRSSTSRTGTTGDRPTYREWVALHVGSPSELRWFARNVLGAVKFVLAVVAVVAVLYVLLGAR